MTPVGMEPIKYEIMARNMAGRKITASVRVKSEERGARGYKHLYSLLIAYDSLLNIGRGERI